LAVVADEVEFAFYAARGVIAGDEDVAVAAELPISVSFAADAGAAGGVFAVVGVMIVAEPVAGSPVDELGDGAGDQRHGVRVYKSNFTRKNKEN
jgi:hypothetical protein